MTDEQALAGHLAEGIDPVVLMPDLLYMRCRYDYMPRTLTLGPREGPVEAAMFLPPMHRVPILDHDEEILRTYRELILGPEGDGDDR